MIAASTTTQSPPCVMKPARASVAATVNCVRWASRAWARRSRTAAGGILNGAIDAHPTRRVRLRLRRAGPIRLRPKAVASADPNSPPTAPGRLASNWPMERMMASGSSDSQWNGRAAGDEYTSRRCNWAARRLLARRRSEMEVRPNNSGPPSLATLAPGTTITRKPASRARTEKSSAASTLGSAGSNPPSEVQRLRRTSMPPAATPRTSERTSCWAWSSSLSTNGIEAP